MKVINLTAQLRENVGAKGKLNAIRKSGMVPAVIYGDSKPSYHISVPEKDLTLVIKSGRNAVMKIKYANNEEDVIIKEIQRHVVTGKIIHVDFYRISLAHKIEIKVPIKLTGEAFGVKSQGGIIEHNMRELTIRCLPMEIPPEIVVDITNLHIGNSIKVKDLKYEKIEIKEDPDQIIASIIAPKEEAITTPTQPSGKEEPEVIAKGKKEESEGKEAKPGEEKAEKSGEANKKEETKK